MECEQATFRCKLVTISVYICSIWLENDLKADLIVASESCSSLCFKLFNINIKNIKAILKLNIQYKNLQNLVFFWKNN